jgi:MIP family channel proteins
MDVKLRNALMAEFVGTFTLVFIGAAAVTVAGALDPSIGQLGVIIAALAHGLILVGLAASYGAVSGGHFNPAVTAAMLVGGQTDALRAALYIITQLVAGVIAAFLLIAVIQGETNYGQTKGILTDVNVWGAAVFEAILTFILVSTIYQSAVHGKAGNIAAIAIGLTLAGAILAGGVYTGASLNPARTLGPALVAGDLSYVIPYFIGTFGGGILGGLFHAYVLNTNTDKQ